MASLRSMVQGLLDSTDLDEKAMQFFRPKTGTLATAGRNLIQPILNKPIPRQLQPLYQGINSVRQSQNPLIQLPQQLAGGVVQGSNLGIGGAPSIAPRTFGQKAAFMAGSMIGAANPKSLTGRVVRPIVAATNPLIAKAIGPVANRAISGRVAAGIGNVAQGAAINPVYGRKPLEGAGIDFATGVLFGPNQFKNALKPIGKGSNSQTPITVDEAIKNLRLNPKTTLKTVMKKIRTLGDDDKALLEQYVDSINRYGSEEAAVKAGAMTKGGRKAALFLLNDVGIAWDKYGPKGTATAAQKILTLSDNQAPRDNFNLDKITFGIKNRDVQPTLYDRAVKNFNQLNPDDAGNMKGFVGPDGKIFEVKDHSEVGTLFGYEKGNINLAQREEILDKFMKDTGSVRIYRHADEMGAEIFSTPNETQLNTIKKALNPDGGDFFIDTPNSMGGGFHYEDIEDGMRQVKELLKSDATLKPIDWNTMGKNVAQAPKVNPTIGDIKNKKFYHMSDKNIDNFDLKKAGGGQGENWYGNGAYLQQEGTSSIEHAMGAYGRVKSEFTLSPKAKVFDGDIIKYAESKGLKTGNFDSKVPRDVFQSNWIAGKGGWENRVVEALKKDGFDAYYLDGELVVYNPDKLIKTTSPNVAQAPKSDMSALEDSGLVSGIVGKSKPQSTVGDLRKPQLGSYTNIRQADNPLVNQPIQNGSQSGPAIKIRQSQATPQPAGVLTTLKKQFQTTAKSLSQEANLKQQKYSTAKSLEQIIDNQPIDVKNKVGLIDYVRTPDRVLKKIGLEKESNLIRAQYDKYLTELPKEIDKITAWSKQVPKESNQRIFNYLDGQKVTLTAQEAKVAGEIREYLEQWADKLNLPKDKRIASYITHIFEKDFIQKEFDPELAKLIQDRVAGSVYDPFLEQRLGKLGYVEDTWRALDAYVKRATRKLHMDPALEQTKKAAERLETSQFDYVKNYVDRINLRPTKLDNLVDNTIKQLVGYRFGQRPTAYLTRKGRQAVYRGTLGLNVGSALKNLSQGANTYAKLGEKYTIKGYLDLLRNGTDELNSQGVLKQEFIQDRNINATKKFWEKVDKGLFVFFDTAELINRGSAYYGAKAKALAKGASETDAIEYAKKIVRDTQFTFGSVDTPIAMQSDMAKLISQFQSFTLKQSEFLGEMAKNKEYAGLLRYALASMAFVYAAGDMIGMEPKDIIPSFRFGLPPTLNLPIELGKAVLGAPDKYGNIPDTQERINNVGKSLIPFIPAGTQAKKTITGLEGVNKGYSETASGRVRFPIQQSTSNYIKGGVFGPWSLPEAREYFDKNRSVLSENQSALLKQATDKFGVYGEIIQKRELNKLIDKAREDIKSGKQSSVDAGSIKVVKVGDKIREIDMNRLANPPAYPQTTGNELLDKELVKDFKSSITAIKNDVTDLYKAGEISKEEAQTTLAQLDTLYKTGSSSKGKKPKAISIKRVSPKSVRVSAPQSTFKPMALNIKPFQPSKIKLSRNEYKPIDVSQIIKNPLPIQKNFGNIRVIG